MKGLKKALIFLFILLLILTQPPISYALDSVDVSPGKYDYKLGKDFPTEDSVKFHYPNSTILTNSTGELLINVTLTTYNYTGGDYPDSIIKSISIHIPPEFTINNGLESVWTSFTNDYSSISWSTALSNDPIAPNWSILSILNLNITKSQDQVDVKNRIFLENNTQYIRIFNVTSPSIAGRYFLKVFVVINGLTYSIGATNFPTIVVKADLNPAYASGIIRHGDPLKPNLYGKPLDNTVHSDGTILLPDGYGGKILAEGLTSKGRRVYAQAYFNASAEGRYTLYGIAPATYNVTVQAAGYPPKRFLEAFSVVKSQSLEGIDFYLNEGSNISGTVFSKHVHEKIPWGHVYDIWYGVPTMKTIRIDVTDLNEIIIASSPLKLYNDKILDFRPQDKLDPSKTDYDFFLKREVAFDGHIPQDYANYTSGIPSGDYYVKAHATDYVQLDSTVIHVTNNTRKIKTDIDLQRTNYFEIKVHFKNAPGNTKPMPTPIGGFLYLEVLDATGAVVGFNSSYVPQGSSNFTMQVRGIDIWNRMVFNQTKRIAWIFSHDRGLLPGTYTINALYMNQTTDFIALNALILSSPELRLVFPTTTGPLVSTFSTETLELTNRQTPLYFQLSMIKGSIGPFCNSATSLSFDLIRGGGFNITLYSVNWQRPATNVGWAHPGSRIQIDIQTFNGELIDTIYATQPPVGSSLSISTLGEINWEDGFRLFGRGLGLSSGEYILKIYTPGYIEDEIISPITIEISLGTISDLPINMIRGARINLTVVFRTENLFEPIDNKLCYARPIHNIDATPVRIEVFDDFGEFVAADTTYVKRGSSNVEVFLDGFNQYYGNPRLIWTNFYDTTDGNRQFDSGLDNGIYQIRISIPGYYQYETLQTIIYSGEIKTKPTISIDTSIERLAYLSGTVDWINWIGIIYPMSWATITAYHTNGTEEIHTFSLDGSYQMWLVPGKYDFGLYHPGFEIQIIDYGLFVTWGSCAFIRFVLHENWPPETIPEFSAASLNILLVLSILLSFSIIRLLKGRSNISQLN
ncbi:MAG: carboxypeptidase-like regulatory domain-containing protein [Candidatus Bathyarchaeota archaeon]|nr:carboxypeptidase-like regulatory domain-containing protein [Candidatus Bathyarchaeota archaeon]